MNMNPAMLMKLTQARDTFFAAHPKAVAFARTVLSRPMEDGTIVEMTITRPGEAPISANLMVQPSDLELIALLKELGGR